MCIEYNALSTHEKKYDPLHTGKSKLCSSSFVYGMNRQMGAETVVEIER